MSGNRIFTVRLLGSGNMLLVHPVEECGMRFLPCVYGYATTVRRAQGADLDLGCVYFDQPMVAGRGYGYVGVSRFRSRSGCYLYGKLRRSDFLPVGPGCEGEVLERGYDSVSSSESDGAGLEYAFGASGDEAVDEASSDGEGADEEASAGGASCEEGVHLACDFA